jgi:acyl-coenzyme A thioesterase 7
MMSNNHHTNGSTTRSTFVQPVVVVSRLLLPDDANPAGNVHGGTTLRLMEEAGMIAATRHIMSASAAAVAATAGVYKMDSSSASTSTSGGGDVNNISAVLARFENMSFHAPLYVGEVASLTARPIFTSEHSILIQVVVTGENVFTGKTRVTNTGKLWYVPLLLLSKQQPGVNGPNTTAPSSVVAIKVPPILAPSVDNDVEALKICHENARLSYEARKNTMDQAATDSNNSINSSTGALSSSSCRGIDDFRKRYNASSNAGYNAHAHRSPADSEQTLCQVVLPGDCSKNGIAFGGFLMKLMDNAAGCSAYRHCRTNVVTVSISSIDFLCLVRLGDVCTIHSRVVYCSNKTLEMQVKATVTCARTIVNDLQDKFVAFGRFTFTALDDKGKAIRVPPLRLESDEDFERAFHGEQRYRMAKKAREQEQQQRLLIRAKTSRQSKL